MVKVLDVEDATKLAKSVEVETPLITVVKVVPLVKRPEEEMMVVVAISPLIFVVKILFVTFCEKELMILVARE